ncbi:hypothetical protein [Leucobacter chromiiresistens]|uniref:Uncharacterized protein n=1 Tax=Leucobacter chromiiresistens TaxID=1079994 RepID=A0A1H0YPL3_9MICO|nr:hypothetical protein [Leucobacter chromiiresistens]SDQ17105.1 hypothetical protein SAMN04488565_1075 [Leucobacter chromiiresistens]
MDAGSLPVHPHNASIMLRPDGRVFIETYSQPHTGAWISDGFPIVLAGLEGPVVLGEAILDGLERSTYDVYSADELRSRPTLDELYAWAGVRNWKQYTKGSKSVSVYSRYAVAPPTSANISPEERERSGACAPIDDAYREGVRFQSAEELGRLVQEAMNDARA